MDKNETITLPTDTAAHPGQTVTIYAVFAPEVVARKVGRYGRQVMLLRRCLGQVDVVKTDEPPKTAK